MTWIANTFTGSPASRDAGIPGNDGYPTCGHNQLLYEWKRCIDQRLADVSPNACSADGILTDAWTHSVLAPGKRIRGLLLLSVLNDLGRVTPQGLDCACALELVHTASLVLDDLPCMDNAALRRGRTTLHRQIGESSAILAAIAMLSEAFALAASSGNTTAVSCLARAIGADGLVGGQITDLSPMSRDARAIAQVYTQKTGALFQAACAIAVAVAGCDERSASALQSFSHAVGLAFQIADDTLDGASDPCSTGKDVGIDRPGSTLAAIAGISAAHRWSDMAMRSATSNLSILPRSECTHLWLTFVSSIFADMHQFPSSEA